MIKIKDKQSIEKMRIAGQAMAKILSSVSERLVPGVTTLEIDTYIEQEMRAAELTPMCIGYPGRTIYRHATCISLNDVVVHGVPSEKIVLKNGDLVKIDVVGAYKGYCADMARCYFVGEAPALAKRLVDVAQRALDRAIQLACPGNRLSDISAAIQQEVEKEGFGVVRDFVGHGIGKQMHEDPQIPNFGVPGKGPILQAGMVFAIEPMITAGNYAIRIAQDGWTAHTRDGSLAGHVEDTVAITEVGPDILTRLA